MLTFFRFIKAFLKFFIDKFFNIEVNANFMINIEINVINDLLFKKFRINIDFKIENKIIYYIDNNEKIKLCIFKNIKKKIFNKRIMNIILTYIIIINA